MDFHLDQTLASKENAEMNMGHQVMPAEKLALDFAGALARRDYRAAYELTSREFQSGVSCQALQQAFESIVPDDWGVVDPIEVASTLEDWPAKQASDEGWLYVVLGGEVYSEGITLVAARDEGALKVRQVEWGRP